MLWNKSRISSNEKQNYYMSGWLHCCVFLPWSVKICLSNELPLNINSIIIHISQKSRDTRSHHSLIRRNENVVYNNTGIFSWPWLLPVLLAKEILKSMVRILSSKKNALKIGETLISTQIVNFFFYFTAYEQGFMIFLVLVVIWN